MFYFQRGERCKNPFTQISIIKWQQMQQQYSTNLDTFFTMQSKWINVFCPCKVFKLLSYNNSISSSLFTIELNTFLFQLTIANTRFWFIWRCKIVCNKSLKWNDSAFFFFIIIIKKRFQTLSFAIILNLILPEI